jgi:hypothetical protein
MSCSYGRQDYLTVNDTVADCTTPLDMVANTVS